MNKSERRTANGEQERTASSEHGRQSKRGFLFPVLCSLLTVLAGCAPEYPNTTFEPRSDFARTIDDLWDQLLFWGTIVFVLVETILLFTIIKFRQRRGGVEPRHVHGNTALEIAWTLIPAIILVFIAVPTVRANFVTQRDAPVPGTVQVEVIGHQWWWEFRYPEYGIVTANELYLPVGRTVNFALKTADVLHSFWIPQMGGKRDLISNRTNYLWYTPDSTLANMAWNGICAEYCGLSHANMRLRAFTVTPEEFERWVAHQQSPAAFGAVPTAPAVEGDTVRELPAIGAGLPPQGTTPLAPPGERRQPASGTEPYTFPVESLRPHNMPATPIPAGLTLSVPPESGDPERGREIYSRSACIGCHVIRGNPSSVGLVGPTLTHFGSRTTLGAGLYPNSPRYLAVWIKNAQRMKPGALMPPQGAGERDRVTGIEGTLSDEEIADIVAYMMALR